MLHNVYSAMVAADGIRKMDVIYSDQIEMNQPDLTQVSNKLLRILQELIALIGVNFFKIVFPGFSLERVYGTLVLRDEKENDLLSVYDGQIGDGIIHAEKLSIKINLREHPEAVMKILPPEIVCYLLLCNERIDLDKLLDRQHKIIRNKRRLSELFKHFSEFQTAEDQALWLVTSHKLEQEIEDLMVFDVSNKQINFDNASHLHDQIIDEDFVDDENEEYYVELPD